MVIWERMKTSVLMEFLRRLLANHEGRENHPEQVQGSKQGVRT